MRPHRPSVSESGNTPRIIAHLPPQSFNRAHQTVFRRHIQTRPHKHKV
ncbi:MULTISPECIES: hypothetical protein [Neisseria]|uniref:Uncharacterized protein n=1 Tax=Neisseria cinerea TaxID=483 RepID=A0A7T3BNH6_NEICI|nr:MULTISPECIES: hypothetical protein [Neisseria]QPT38079.1 hypothetical protein I6G28_00350 [Neisseria cinerea]